MMEGEHDVVVRELNLSSDQLETEKARVDTTKASLAIMSTCLDKSAIECTELIAYWQRCEAKGRRTSLEHRCHLVRLKQKLPRQRKHLARQNQVCRG